MHKKVSSGKHIHMSFCDKCQLYNAKYPVKNPHYGILFNISFVLPLLTSVFPSYLCRLMIFRYILVLLIGISLLSCDRKSAAILKGNDLEAKQKLADDYYAKEKYEKAIPIYEELLTVLKGQKSVEDIYFKYAKAQYLNGSYELAAFYLKSFYNTYFQSKDAEEAAFLEAMCYYNQSPRYTLEQINTQQALEIFQGFINKYPNSTRIAEANTKMDELRAKLRKKSYEAAYLYYKIQQYNAAAVALRNFLDDYPEYENPEKIEYLIVKALKSYADESTKAKKSERYTASVSAYNEFAQKYPNSQYLEELNKLNKSTLNNLENAK